MGAVARDLVRTVRALHREPLVGGAAHLVALDRIECLRLGVFQEPDQVVVVDVWVAPRSEAQREEQVLPGDVALDHRGEPLRINREAVLIVARPAAEVDAHAFGSEVDVPAALHSSSHIEPHSHVDPLAKVRAQLAQSVEMLHELIGQLRSWFTVRGVRLGYLWLPGRRICIQVLGDVAV